MKNRFTAMLLAILCLLLALYIFGEVKKEHTVNRYPAQEEQTVIMR